MKSKIAIILVGTTLALTSTTFKLSAVEGYTPAFDFSKSGLNDTISQANRNGNQKMSLLPNKVGDDVEERHLQVYRKRSRRW